MTGRANGLESIFYLLSFLLFYWKIAFIILFSFHNVGRNEGFFHMLGRDNRILNIFLLNDDCEFSYFANYLLVTIFFSIHEKDMLDDDCMKKVVVVCWMKLYKYMK